MGPRTASAVSALTCGVLVDGPAPVVLAVTGVTVSSRWEDGVPAYVAEDGGWQIDLTGVFPLDAGVSVSLVDEATDTYFPCNPTAPGSLEAVSVDGHTLAAVTPPLARGAYRVYVRSGDYEATMTMVVEEAEVYDFAVLVVPASFVTPTYSLRGALPPPRDVGAYSVEEEP